MPGLFATALSVSLWMLPIGLVQGASAPAMEPTVAADPVDEAEAAWGADPPNYLRVREILEPIAAESIDEPARRQRVLLLLADATILDPTLPKEKARETATEYLNRLMDADTSFQGPMGMYSAELDVLWRAAREARSQRRADQCEGRLLACDAKITIRESEIKVLSRRYADLETRYNTQEVQQVEVQTRTRALAIFPLGISHFYNGKMGWGAGFLAAEATFGIAGMALLIYRTTADGCKREQGFRPGSLQCAPRRDTSEDAVVARRKWEEAMAWAFLGTAVFDVVMAQVLFEKTTVVSRGMKKRSELEGLETIESPPRRRRRDRTDRRTSEVRATVRPTPAIVNHGAGLGFRFRF